MLEKWRDIISALGRKPVTDLAGEVLTASYKHFFPGHEEEAEAMLKETFLLLQESRQKGNADELDRVTRHISSSVFRKNENSFWFNRLHAKYKTETRSQTDFKFIQGDIAGKRILDFGSNGGYFALELEKHGFDVLTTDVMDFRDTKARHLPFKKMDSPVDIPFGKDEVDTAIIKTVFHHIKGADLLIILKGLRRIAKRIIIKEDLYGVKDSAPGFQPLLAAQPELRRFARLTREDQYYYLVLIDYLGNAVAHGLADMSLFFNFHTLEYWQELLVEHGFIIRNTKFYGFERTKLHNSLQVWITCDRSD